NPLVWQSRHVCSLQSSKEGPTRAVATVAADTRFFRSGKLDGILWTESLQLAIHFVNQKRIRRTHGTSALKARNKTTHSFFCEKGTDRMTHTVCQPCYDC